MVPHINGHLAKGHVEAVQTWMQEHNKVHCRVCGLCVDRRYGVHPTCRPLERAAVDRDITRNTNGMDDEDSPGQDDAPVLPSLEHIMTRRVPVLKHVPKSCRHAWAQALTRALARVSTYNSMEAWTELIMLPKAVLLAPPRKGKKHTNKTAAFTLDRLCRWEAGERATLWDDLPAPHSKPRKPQSNEECIKHAVALCREGFDRKACAALIAGDMCDENADTAKLLAPLHPQSPAPTSPPMHELPWNPEITPGMVSKVLRSFPLDSAPGPSGLRVQHLLEAQTPSQGAAVAEQLTQVVQLLAQGRAPAELAEDFAGAKLLALKKPKGRIWPIAIGEVLRRIVGKCLCDTVKEDALQFFAPFQVGVACKLGIDAAVHSCRKWAELHKQSRQKALLKIDFSNAFNCVSRDVVLRQVRSDFPAVSRWVTWCYAKPSKLVFGTETVASAAGVQQGDPLGPLLFSLAIHAVVKELNQLSTNNNSTLDISTFYLDDGILAGDIEAVAQALRLLESRCPALGLSLNHSKCELVLPGEDTDANLDELFPRDLLWDKETGESRVFLKGCFEILGASVGDKDFCENYTRGKVEKATQLLQQISCIEDPQVALRLLRNCAGVCKITHNMRMVPTHFHPAALKEFDKEVQNTFCKTTGLLPDRDQWQQACRGFKHAGLGLRGASLHGEAAYLASTCASRDKCHKLLQAFSLNADSDTSHFGVNLAAYNAKLPPGNQLTPQNILTHTQKQLSDKLDEAGHDQRLQQASLGDRATLLSECQQGAKEFWQVTPSVTLGLAVPAEEFVTELRLHLCMLESPEDDWCPLCDQVLDARGHHARDCCAGGDRTRRHNGTRNKGFNFAKAAGCNPELEKANILLPSRPGDTTTALRRPADVYLPTWTHGLPAALDFAITAPQRQGIVGRAAANALAAANEYCDTKRSFESTEAQCNAAGVTFLPMVAETSGAWAPESLAVWKQLATSTAVRQGRDAAAVLREMLQSLSVTIRRANARACLRRFSA